MFTRIMAGALALFHGLNAAAMIAAPGDWYAATPGVPLTGLPSGEADVAWAFSPRQMTDDNLRGFA